MGHLSFLCLVCEFCAFCIPDFKTYRSTFETALRQAAHHTLLENGN
jgi:hypothetical protein